MNIRLLRRIQKHILAEPRRYDQNEIMGKARVAVRRIDHFIKTKGAE